MGVFRQVLKTLLVCVRHQRAGPFLTRVSILANAIAPNTNPVYCQAGLYAQTAAGREGMLARRMRTGIFISKQSLRNYQAAEMNFSGRIKSVALPALCSEAGEISAIADYKTTAHPFISFLIEVF